MRTADMIKSKYFRARDVEGVAPFVLTIADVSEELLGRPGSKQDVKCILWFMESPKGLQLNKTRVKLLEAAYGPDSVGWNGKKIKLYFDPTIEFGGRPVGGVGIKTSPGVVYNGTAHDAAWGAAPAQVPGRPPPPVWDEQRQMYVMPQPSPAAAAPRRPPPPVWNEATQSWDIVNTATGEIAGAPAAPPVQPQHQRPQTISERINAGHPPGGAPADDGWGSLPPQRAPAGDFDDDIPF